MKYRSEYVFEAKGIKPENLSAFVAALPEGASVRQFTAFASSFEAWGRASPVVATESLHHAVAYLCLYTEHRQNFMRED
jgi:hypothetical protein